MVVPPPSGPGRPTDSQARLIVIAAVAAVLIVAVGAIGIGLVLAVKRGTPVRSATTIASPSPTPGRLITLGTPLTATAGTLVFTDDFHDPLSGWNTTAGASDVNYGYVNGAYVAVAKGGYFYYDPAPYSEPKQQMSVSATATLDTHTPPDAGFGMDCLRGTGSTQVSYEFVAAADTKWYVMRSIGETSTTTPTTLKQGSVGSAPAPGVIPVTLVGVCATMSDGVSMRLVFFIDGVKVADLTDNAPASSTVGWMSDLMTAGSDSGPVTVTLTRFEERDLSRSGP
jgi:hypothetical protein